MKTPEEKDFTNMHEVFEHFLDLYGRDQIPEEIFKYWKIANKELDIKKGKNLNKQYKLIPNGEGSTEQTNAVMKKYDWPHAIKFNKKTEDSHVSWKTWVFHENQDGTLKRQLNYNRITGPARIQIKCRGSYYSYNRKAGEKDFTLRCRWYVEGILLKTESAWALFKLELLGL